MSGRSILRIGGLFRHKNTITRIFNGSRPRKNCSKLFLGAQIVNFVTVSAANLKISDPDPEGLSHTYLIRNAAVATLTSASAMFIHTLSSLIDIMEEYNQSVLELHQLYELSLDVMGAPLMEQKVWDGILKERAKLNKKRQEKQELQTMFNSARKVVEAASEAAFIAGAEYASITASELIHSSQLQYKTKLARTENLEEQLVAVEVKSIEEISKREQDKATPQDIKTLDDLEPVENIQINPESETETENELKEAEEAEIVTEKKEESKDNMKNWFDFGKEKFKAEEEKEMTDPYRDIR